MMHTVAVILSRAGSKGLPDKCVLPLCGRPVLAYSIGHAQESRSVGGIVLSTDSPRAAAIGQAAGITVVERPDELAADDAPVVAAVRHAILCYEEQAGRPCNAVVILYGNIPVRASGIIDQCVRHLFMTECDSVRTVTPVTKQHPDWLHRLNQDRMEQYRPNSIDRRQDLEPLYYHDGAVVVVRRDLLFTLESERDPHAFFGSDRRAVIQAEEDAVDIDTMADFYRAEAAIRLRSEAIFSEPPSAGTRQPPFTAALGHAGSYGRF